MWSTSINADYDDEEDDADLNRMLALHPIAWHSIDVLCVDVV